MFIPNLGPGAYNNLAQAGDQGLIFYGTAPNAGNLVIGPWAGSGSPGLRMTAAGNVGIGTSTPAAKLDVAGSINSSGSVTASSFTGIGAGITGLPNTALSTAAVTRGIVYLAGCDGCGVLGSSDSQLQFYVNVVGPMTINSVRCYSDNNGTSTINIARNNGGPTNLLASPLTCNGTPTTSFTSSSLALLDQLNFVMAAPDGVARRITVVIQATLN